MKGEKKFDIKKKLSKIFNLKVFLIIAILVILFSIYQLLTRDKFVFNFDTLSSYTVNDNIDFDITVYRDNDMSYRKYYEYEKQTLSDKLLDKFKNNKVNLKMTLYDVNGKKVKGVSEKVKVELKEKNDIELELPENLEPGIYTLKTKARKGLLYDKVETEFNLDESSSDLITISMDKGIYKPGDEVKFRALITNNRDNKPIEENVTISIYDGNENRVYFEEAKTSEFGIISGVFKIGDEVNSGIYKLALNIGRKEKVQNFKVESYTEERFKVEIASTKDVYTVNENIEFDISANYFFGEPVVDATIEVIDESKKGSDITQKLRTNSSGHATFKTKKTESGIYNFTVKATDSSNYYVEKTHMVTVSNSSFNIDIVPEFGDIVTGVKNRIYVYVKDHQNNPVEAICALEVKNVAREFSTDENGVGFVDLSSSDVATLLKEKNNNNKIFVRVQNEAGEIIDYSEKYNVIKINNVLRTDSVIYNQNDEIEITLGNYSGNEEKIYVVKKGELIRTLDISNENVTFSLEDTFGLIDFYIIGTTENRESRLNKRTVFIKPKEGMKLSLSTNSEEYKPSDNMTLSISNSNGEDAAYLVSIIDTANLNIADNDLNIDKIKLALEDVKFTDGVDAATVYASIMAEASEIELEKLLMKQSSSDFNINSNRVYPEIDLDIYRIIISITVLISISLFAIMFAYYNLTGKEGNKLFDFVSRTLVINVLTMFLLLNIIDEFIGMEIILELGLSIILAIVLYIKVLVKYEKYIAKVLYEILSPILIGYGFAVLAFIMSEFIGGPLSLALLAIIGLLMYKKRNSVFTKVVLRLIGIALKNLIIIYVSLIVASILDFIFDFSYRYLEIINVISVIAAYILLYRYEKGKKKYQSKKNKKQDENGNIEVSKHKDIFYYIGVGFVVFCVISVIASSSVLKNFSNSIDDGDFMEDVYVPSGSMSSSKGDIMLDASQFGEYGDDVSADVSMSQIIPDMDFSFDLGFKNSAESIVTDNLQESFEEENELSNQGMTEEEKVHIRNVFLESLAFLPEVVAEKGNTDIDIKLSDNITTWKVQVIGNTKSGDVSYTNTEFKVFKEFFVDFTVPNNLKVGDIISVPATVYNYTENGMMVNLKVNEDSWFKTDNMNYSVNVDAKGQALVYIKLEILKQGKENKLRIEASSNSLKDIIEKVVPVEFNGIELSDISASGSTGEDISGEVIFKDEFIENSNSVTVNIYPNLMAFAVEGMDSILKMPNGCFEQVSSSLYPDIMVLSYLESASQEDDTEKLKEKAIEYINKGYQKLLTYEVKGESGGFSLYGDPKAETVLTAYGLMELNDLSKVYPVDEKVLERMEKFLSKKQKSDGSFELTGGTTSNLDSRDNYSNNAYILWAVSEYNQNSAMLKKGVNYLKNNMEKINDTYTLALIANVLVNVDDSAADKCIDKLIDKLNTNTISNNNIKYLECDCIDYMGTRNSRMNIQATALLSMALSKENTKATLNQELVDYIISQRGRNSWGTTQTTVLALRAINEYNKISKSVNQKLKITVGDDTKEVEIKKSGVTFIRFDFDNLNNDKTVTYEIKGIKSNIYYEIVKNYFVEYDKYKGLDDLDVKSEFEHNEYNVNDVINQKISIRNNIGNSIKNIMVEVQIPQGCTLIKDTLEKAVTRGEIEKYEFNYGKVFIYLRDLKKNGSELIDLEYRALYPVDIKGGAVRVYDYYNPETVEYIKPEKITVY